MEDNIKKFLLEEVLNGDQDAYEFIMDFFNTCHAWDAVIDGDEADGTDEWVNTAFFTAFFLHESPFYQTYGRELAPLMRNAMITWQGANIIEQDPDYSEDLLRIAHGSRQDIINIIIHCAYIVGGVRHAVKVTPRVWALTAKLSWSDYLEEHPRA